MPYRYTTFDGVNLPEVMPEDDLGTGATPSTLIDSLGGAFDYLGTARYRLKRQPIRYVGKYVGRDDTYLVDESGNFVVDESGNYIVATDDYTVDLRDKVDALKAKVGRRGTLIRKREDDASTQSKQARLLSINHTRTVRDIDRFADLEIVLEATGGPWKSTTATTTSDTLAASDTTIVDVESAGMEEVRDAVITITANGANVTSVEVVLNSDQHWTWTGTLLDGNDLVIDTGALTVTNNNVDAYTGFALSGDHTIDGWLQLAPSNNVIYFTIVGGPADLSVVHYDQWM